MTKIKIDVISGFLGAGKTTLIKKLLEEDFKNEKLVIIENEFGEIGIDGSLLKKSGIEIRELNSGCICCTLVGDFENSIKDVIEKFKPERIIIEPSGVGKLSEVIKACDAPGLKEVLRINMLVAVVDVLKYQMYIANFGEFYENQIVNAKTVILSRTQKVPREKLEKVVNSIRRQSGMANIITTPWESLKAERIIAVAEGAAAASLENRLMASHKMVLKGHVHGAGCKCGREHEQHDKDCGCESHHVHSHNADEVFEVWSIETPGVFEETEIKELLGRLDNTKTYGMVLRGKGILQNPEGQWLQFDYVPGEVKVVGTEADYTGRLAIIGRSLNRNELGKLFMRFDYV